MFRRCVFAVCLLLSQAASPARAWHEVGHFLTVLVAYKQLSPSGAPSQTIQELVAILKHHPRFQEDFARSMPKGLSADGEARWLLCRASVWPDQIRADRENPPTYPPQPDKQGSYHRGIWHYIDIPLVIVANDASADQVKALNEKARASQNLAADAPQEEADVKNALQAIAFNRTSLAHGKPDEQAVALCWLLHVIADLHQPLHATAAFSLRALEPTAHPHGDEGGNAIHLGDHRNLHALWDAAPDANPDATYDPAEPFDQRYNRAYARALKQFDLLQADSDLAARGKAAAADKDPQEWARESYELAKKQVYTTEVREQILAFDRANDDSQHDLSIKLPDGYRAGAHEIGKLRVVQGGYRLAEFLRSTKIRRFANR